MIILNFLSQGTIQYTKIAKPQFCKKFQTELAKRYSESTAEQYSKDIESFIQKNMNFPENGIYYLSAPSNTLFVYCQEKDVWMDTNKKTDDYTIGDENSIWDIFCKKYPYLRKNISELKESTHNITKILFSKFKWKDLSYIDLSTLKTHENIEKSICDLLKRYFSDNELKNIYSQIMQILFSIKDIPYVVLYKKESIIQSILTKDSAIIPLNIDNIPSVESMLTDELSPSDLNDFMVHFKNLILFGRDNSKYQYYIKPY